MSRSTGRVFRRGDTWWLDYWAPTGELGPDGTEATKRVRESSGSERKADATRLLRKRQREIEDGTFATRSEDLTFGDLSDLILADYRRKQRKSTKRLRTSLSHLSDTFDGWPVRRITSKRIDEYADARLEAGAAPSSVQKEIAALRRAFRLAYAKELVPKVPAFPTIRVNNTRKVMPTLGDVERICEHLPTPLALVVRFAALTGIRKANVLGLQWRQVRWEEGVIVLETSKTGDGREFPFRGYPQLHSVLEDARAYTDEWQRGRNQVVPHVFHRQGAPIRSFRWAWNKACAAAGRPELVFHDLRRTAVRIMVNAGLERSRAMKLTGHKTESMFERYNLDDRAKAREDAAKLGAAVAEAMQGEDGAQVTPLRSRDGAG